MAEQLLVAGSYASASDPGIRVLAFDDDTGELREVRSCSGVENPSWVLVHPTEPFLYAVGETGDEQGGGSVAALSWAPAGDVAVLNVQDSHGGAPCHLTLDPSGRWLVVCNYFSGTIAVFGVQEGGTLTEAVAVVAHSGSSVHAERQQSPHTHSSRFTPDGVHLLVADLGTDEVVVYHLDPDTGALDRRASVAARAGAGPRHMVFAADASSVFVANELDSTLSRFRYDATAGSLGEVAHSSTLPSGATEENLPSELVLDADGRRVFLANRGHDSVATFDVTGEGAPVLLGTAACGGDWPRHVCLSPSGRWLLVSNQKSGDIAVLPMRADVAGRSPGTGFALPGASCVQFVATAP